MANSPLQSKLKTKPKANIHKQH